MTAAALVYADALSRHVLSDTHPMRPIRLAHMYKLAAAAGFLDSPNSRTIEPRPATGEELALAHASEYIDAVRRFNDGGGHATAAQYGFGPGDNPLYPGIFDAQALSAGSAMAAAQLVASGDVDTAFAPAGGLHHAMRSRASGFCVFNDPAMAIEHLTRAGNRVAYVDIDCHHGDGVQAAFYDRADVLTISLHESGQFLFPGAGFTTEIGTGEGEGFSVNVPLAPYTSDDTYRLAFEAVVPPLIEAFKPDVLVTQLGIDTHVLDPITHLRLTTQGFARTVAALAGLARTVGKWIALGGGGYDLGAVARGWSMAYAVMTKAPIPDDIPAEFTAIPGLTTFADPIPPPPEPTIADQIAAYAAQSVHQIQSAIFPRLGIG